MDNLLGQVTHTEFHVPEAVGELAIILAVAGIAVVLHAVFQRRFHSDLLRRHNDVAGFLFSAVGVIYAVVLGFVVVVVWQKYDATVANIENEVAAVSDLYRVSAGFPPDVRADVRAGLAAYVHGIITLEWPHLSQHLQVEPTLDVLERVAKRVDTFVPANAAQVNAQQLAMTQVARVFDARRERLIQSVPNVPSVLWFALFAGAAAMLAFAYLFGVENRPAQLIMTGILAGLIAILFIVIAEFDSPYDGSVSISNDGWVILQSHLKDIP